MKKVVVLLCLAFACILALDSIVLTGVARDVFPCSGDAQKYKCGQNYGNGIPTPAVNVCRLCQPEFQSTNAWQKDIVKKDLDANRKPVFNNTAYRSSFSATNGSLFYTWYNNDANYNFPINVNLTFTNTDSQPNVYSMYSENFFPVDNQGFGNYADNTVPRNYHFTFELKSRFFYRGNETFSFSGDDDVWVFINNKLAIDLGGVHGEQTANLILNQSATLLGITPNNTYNFDFFFAERHTWSSRCKISTSLELTCAKDWCGVCQGDGQSCCKANDNNACTVDTCNPTTGAPIYTPVTTCTGSNRCLNYLCNQTATVTPGCYTTPVTCQPLNACYTASCSTSVGCQNTLKNCDDGDACTTDACDATLGCTHTPIVCDDKNGCTNDTCSKDNGCSYVPISCDDKNACTSDSCDVNGVFPACSNLPVNINDDDECTIDSCNSVTGVAHNPLNCNDNNACTADSCDSSVGCQNVNVTCNDGDGCTTDSCSKDSGCSFKPYTCNDNDACTVDSCNSSAPYPGCSFKSVNPDDGDLCTTDSCNKITGVSHVPVNCDDGNACTQDACNSTVGCYYETVTCDDQDECTIDSCSNSTGCVFEKKNCDDKDDCTIDECDSNHPGGCKNTRISPCLYCSPPTGEKPTCPPSPDACHPIVCDNAAEDCVFKNVTCDDKNACTSDSCKDVNGIAVCQFTPITDSRNTACTPYTCNPQSGVFTAATAPCANKNPCLKGSCAVSSNNTANCTFTAVECETIDVCSPASCSLSNGSCITTAIDCNDGNECTRDYCKKVGDAAQCFNDYIPADDEDACHPYSCDSKTGVHTALELPCVDGNLCTDDSCALNGTSYSCTFSAIECKATNACVPQVCDSGKCVVVPVVCNDGNPCTNDSAIINANGQCECVFTSYECPSTDACFPATCNVTTGKCDVAPVVCDDHNVCTNDTCVAGNCSYKAYECNDGNECTTDTCVAANNVGCTFTKITCDDKNACTTDTCNPLVGCQFTTSNLSDPGVCKTSYCDNNLGVVVQDQVCRPADRCSCVDNKCQCQSFLQQYETQAKITGGVIAGIIIGVVAFVVLAALGGKKGYDFYKASKDPALAVEDNPLYEGSNKDVENPLYESNKE